MTTAAEKGGSPATAVVDPLGLLVRLLRGRPSTRAEVVTLVPSGMDPAAALRSLAVDGFMAVSPDGVELVDPRVAVAALIGEQLAVRDQAWQQAQAVADLLPVLGEAWRAPTDAGTAVPGSVTVSDGAAWWQVALDLAGSIDIAAVTLHNRPHRLPTDRAVRLLVPVRELRDPRVRHWVITSGAQVRVTRQVPGWLAVGDAVALALRWGESTPTGSTETSEPSIVAAFGWIFAHLWQSGVSVEQLDVLTLLGLGCEDADAAAVLGTSVRTVQRRIAAAMEVVGARSRFDLAVAWASTSGERP